MKAVGITRKVDKLGRLILPKELREALDINHKDSVEMFYDGELLYVKKYFPECVFCESAEDVIKYNDKFICMKCISELKGL